MIRSSEIPPPDSDIRRILIATDMSELAAGALRFGDAFRDRLGASALVMFANDGAHLADEELRRYLASHVARPGAFNVRVVYEPSADEAILRTADEIDADLIVMGTRGRTGWARAVLGSVAESVLHKTERAVMTIGSAASGRESAVRSILCPVNFTPLAHSALRRACSLARAFDAELTVMHVADRPADVSAHIRATYDRWLDEAIREECRYDQVYVTGDPAEVIVRAADEKKTSLIVLGARHRRFRDETVGGTTAERVIRSARVPVLTVLWKSVWEAHSAA